MKTITQRLLLIISVLSITYFLASCKKSNTPAAIIPTVTSTSVINVSRTSATINAYVNSSGNSTVTATGVCYATTPNPTITNSVVAASGSVGEFSVNLVGLSPSTTYYARPFATNTYGTAYGGQLIFVTPSITFNLTKYYNSLNNNYYNPSQIASVVGARHEIYGTGFLTAGLTLKLIARNNAADVINPVVTVTNDTTLSFKIPENLIIGQNPYVGVKEYYLTLNNVVFRSFYGSFNPSKLADSAIFQIVNKGLNIASVQKVTTTPCNYYAIMGSFGSSSLGGSINPDVFLGVPTKPISRRLIVKAGGVFFKSYPITKTNASCGEAAFTILVMNQTLVSFHDPAQITLYDGLPTGNISVQIENKMADGSIVLSNESTFVN